ncbi:unnamed protein product [Coregonus sp. 'balchen']|nr:unnamed protein product [Coregonus sp. 'balchen']
MVSHYKKVYSANDNDQLRWEQLRKDASSERSPQSARSHSQRSSRTNTRASCPSQNASEEALPGKLHDFHSQDSNLLSRQANSLPSQTFGESGSPPHFLHSASEYSYRSPNFQRQQSAHSCATTGTQSGYRALQNPVQKTYSGDLNQKHAHSFTLDKPFTPRTMKSDRRGAAYHGRRPIMEGNDQMRHLLETLCNDLQSPANTATCSAEPQSGEETEIDLLPSHLQYMESLDGGSPSETKEDNDLFRYALFSNKDSGGLDNVDQLSVSTPLHGSPPERPDSVGLSVGSSDADEGTEGLDEQDHDREYGCPLSVGENTPLTLEEDHNQPRRQSWDTCIQLMDCLLSTTFLMGKV